METVQERISTSINTINKIHRYLDEHFAPIEAYQCLQPWLSQLRNMQQVAIVTEEQLSQLTFIEHELSMDVS